MESSPCQAGSVAEYDAFAWFYDRYWNEEFHSLAFPLLERIWLEGVPPGAHILDLCCGTGYLARLLAGRGYRVTGVDASAEMLAHARAAVPEAEFVEAGAESFRLRHRADAAVCTFDSVNHILKPAELRRVFAATAAALKRGARFAFDVLLEEGYRTNWGEGFSIVRDDHVLLISGSGFDAQTRVARCRITTFRLIDGTWRRRDTAIRERCWSRAEIDDALAAAGFAGATCYDARDLGMEGTLGTGRTFYVARRR